MAALFVKIPSKDVFVASNLPTENFGGSPYLFCGLYLGNIIYRDLLQFDLSNMPSGYIVTRAELNLYIFRNDFPSVSKTFNIYRVKQSFEENTVTFNSQPVVDTVPYASLTLDNQIATYVTFDVTELAKEWYQGDYVNNGLQIRAINEGQNNIVAFYSKEYSSDIYFPRLEISLDNPIMLSSRRFTSVAQTDLVTGDSYSFSSAYDVSEIGNYTLFVINTGSSDNCDAVIQISPNQTNWINDGNVYNISPGQMIGIVPKTFSRYMRLAYKSTVAGNATTIDCHIQTQA